MSFGTGIVKNKSKKGDYAESIVHNYFLSKGWEIYSPSGTKAHLFDGMAIKLKNGIYKKFTFDVKSKSARNKNPDTGVDLKHYIHYKEINQEIGTFLIIFVDEELKKVYFQDINKYISDEKKYKLYIDKYEIKYPLIETNNNNNEKYIYFSLETMIKLKDLSDEEVNILKSYSKTTNKNYKFNPSWDQKKYFN